MQTSLGNCHEEPSDSEDMESPITSTTCTELPLAIPCFELIRSLLHAICVSGESASDSKLFSNPFLVGNSPASLVLHRSEAATRWEKQ